MVSPGAGQNTGMNGIELRGVSKSFGKLEVLSDFSLGIHQGELCCLLGPSGCGKTTALKIIDGLLEADGGRVFLGGQDITDVPTQKRNLGMVFQNYALFPQMDVYENIAYGLRRRHLPNEEIRKRVTEALDMVRLQGIEKRRVHELSGGQQQRIALARALVTQPQALLLDEPLSNLDARLRADMRLEIRRIQRQLGITAVYVTHDQEEAMSIADRIVIMNRGKLEQIGLPQEIYDRPATRFVADFIGRCNFLDGSIRDGQLSVLGQPIEGIKELPSATRVLCAIRPERLRLEAPGNSALAAKVKEVTYLGPVVRYVLHIEDTPSAPELISETPVSRAAFKAGEAVSVVIDPEHIRLLPAG